MKKIKIIKDNKIIFKSYGREDECYFKFDYYNLSNADLSNADLSCADLYNVDLRNADLSYADLYNVYLRNANLSNANLSNVDLRNADLYNVDLSNAKLSNALLRNADLSYANLSKADLSNADLSYSILNKTLLDKEQKIRKGIILDKEIIGYKKAIGKDGEDVIIKLEILKGAVVFSINNAKCRANKCKVLEIENADYAYSSYDEKFIYKKGQEIEVKNFDLIYNHECGTGIHFFRTREEAEDYIL